MILAIKISLICCFVDMLFFKIKIYNKLSLLNETINKAINCEFCRSFWLTLFILLAFVSINKIGYQDVLFLLPACSIIKLITDRQILGLNQ